MEADRDPKPGAVLPHRFPFRLIEADGPGAKILWSRNAFWRDGELPLSLALEALAQAALVVLPSLAEGEAAPRGGLLAGIDEAERLSPIRAGDIARAEVEIEGRFGRLVKTRGRLLVGGRVAVEARFLLALEA